MRSSGNLCEKADMLWWHVWKYSQVKWNFISPLLKIMYIMKAHKKYKYLIEKQINEDCAPSESWQREFWLPVEQKRKDIDQ